MDLDIIRQEINKIDDKSNALKEKNASSWGCSCL